MKEKPKLVKNRKVAQITNQKRTVKGALKRAQDDCFKESWKKCVIVGKRADGSYTMRNTPNCDEEILGILDTAKQIILKDLK